MRFQLPGTLSIRVPTQSICLRRLQFKREHLPHRPHTEPEPPAQRTGPRRTPLRALRGQHRAHPLPRPEEDSVPLRQRASRKPARNVHSLREEHYPHRRRTRTRIRIAARLGRYANRPYRESPLRELTARERAARRTACYEKHPYTLRALSERYSG